MLPLDFCTLSRAWGSILARPALGRIHLCDPRAGNQHRRAEWGREAWCHHCHHCHYGHQAEVSPAHPAAAGGHHSTLPWKFTLAAMVAWLVQGSEQWQIGVVPYLSCQVSRGHVILMNVAVQCSLPHWILPAGLWRQLLPSASLARLLPHAPLFGAGGGGAGREG